MIKHFQINDLISILTIFVRKKRKKIDDIFINENEMNKREINSI